MLEDLADDLVKLVAYTIVFSKAGKERVMPGGQASVIVDDNVSREQFVSRVIAEYLESESGMSSFLSIAGSNADARYMRVHYVVSRRWAKDDVKPDERASTVLERLTEVVRVHKER